MVLRMQARQPAGTDGRRDYGMSTSACPLRRVSCTTAPAKLPVGKPNPRGNGTMPKGGHLRPADGLRDDDQRHRRVTGQADGDRTDHPVGGV